MKVYFLIITLIVSISAFADRGEDHFKEMCQSEDALSAIGPTGSCNIVIAPTAGFVKGICSGMLMDRIPCSIYFDTTPGESIVGMRVICGDIKKPILDQKLDITSSVYMVNALIRTSEGKPIIKKDINTHAQIQSALIDMVVNVNPENKKSASVAFILNNTINPLTGVVCE